MWNSPKARQSKSLKEAAKFEYLLFPAAKTIDFTALCRILFSHLQYVRVIRLQDQSLCADCTATISTLLYQEPSLLETQRLRGSPWGGRTPGICSLFDAESGLQSAGGRWAGLNILRPLLRSWVVYSHTPSPRHMSSPFISSIHWYSAAGRQFERRFFGSFTKDAFHLTCLPVWLSPHMGRSWTWVIRLPIWRPGEAEITSAVNLW